MSKEQRQKAGVKDDKREKGKKETRDKEVLNGVLWDGERKVKRKSYVYVTIVIKG